MAMTKKKPELLTESHGFCPGCGHGIVLRLVTEVLEEMNMKQDDVICALAVSGKQCASDRPAWMPARTCGSRRFRD